MSSQTSTRAVRLQQLLRIAKAVNSTLNLESVLQTIVDTVCDLTNWKMVCIAIVEEATQEVVFVAQRGFHNEHVKHPRWPIAQSLTPKVTQAGKTLVVNDTRELEGYPLVKANSSYRSVLISPLLHVNPVAALWLCRDQPSTFTDDDVAFAEAVADQAAVTIRNATLFHQEKERSRDLTRVNEMLGILMHMVLENRSPSELVSAVSALLRNPLWFEDPFGKRIPDAGGPTVEFGKSLQQGFARWIADGHAALAVPIVSGSDHYGWLVSWETNQRFSDFDVHAVQQAALAFALTFLRDRVRHDVESQVSTDLFVSLMACNQAQFTSDLRRRSHALRIDLPLPARVCLLDACLPFTDVVEHRRSLGDIMRFVSGRIPGRLMALEDDCIAMLLHPGEEAQAAALFPEIARHVRQSEPFLAIGDVADAPDGYLDSLRSARKILRVARFLNLETRVLRSEELGIYGLLFDEARNDELEAFRRRLLGKLMQADEKGQHWETLDALCSHNFNLEATARALGIHISTLRYRLERIRTLSGLEWEDPGLRLQLEVAVVIERWRRKGRGTGPQRNHTDSTGLAS